MSYLVTGITQVNLHLCVPLIQLRWKPDVRATILIASLKILVKHGGIKSAEQHPRHHLVLFMIWQSAECKVQSAE